MRLRLALIALLGPLTFADAQALFDGSTAARWEPRTGWVQAVPTSYGVTDERGALVFRAEGAGTELPWQITLHPDEIAGDARYLVVHYQAEGLSNQPGNYFLHGWEGTPRGLTYAFSDEIEPDGAWHWLAVDLLKVEAQGDTLQIGVKVIVGAGGKAQLTIDRLSFADTLLPGARVSRAGARERQSIALDWQAVGGLTPAPGWTTSPATDFAAMIDGTAATFTVRGVGKQMRWPLKLPEPVDLARLPYFSVRYRASGQLGLATYAVWLGDDASGAGGHSAHPLLARDLRADGQWHTVSVEVKEPFTATQLAVGLDCAGDEATMTLDSIAFSSAPPRWPIAQLLPHEARTVPWPDGQDGFTVLPGQPGGKGSPFLALRLGLADWFSGNHITVAGIPFEVPSAPDEAEQTGTAALGVLSLSLPPTATEVYLLTAAVAPATEPWGIDWAHPKAVEMLSEPEKVVFEIDYTDGPPDLVLPLDLVTGQWGMKRGLGVCVVHPDPGRRPTTLLLHDGMETASFAILGAAMRTDAPRVAEPTWAGLAYPEPPTGALGRVTGAPRNVPGFPLVRSGKLFAEFALMPAFGWSALRAGGADDAIGCSKGPVFEVEIGGKVIPAAEWQYASLSDVGQGMRFVLEHPATHLRATLECTPGVANGLRMQLTLGNTGAEPVTATVRFPVLRGVRLGTVEDTWYLCGRRGGIINHEPVNFREPLGEPHPLQVDGFFNPKTGLALACLTHDAVAQHHFIRLAKNASGGEWAPEYVERDIAPGQAFATTEAELALCEGDWRAIFEAYRAWLRTWFRPPAEKPWWERTFAFITRNAHYDSFTDPKDRGAIQPAIDDCLKYIGFCDYVHLFGWSSSKTYGDWGDYDHYDETVGGLDYFRGNIAQAQAAGVAVGLYQDGYLSSAKGRVVGAHAEEWAIKRADGTPNYVKEYDAYNQCPYMQGWREHLAEAYARIHRDTGVKGMYVDEYGATDGRWICYARDHGHNGYEIPYAGEVEMLKRLREAVGPEVALYSEYPSAEVSRQLLDGSFTYQALWSADQEPLSPHFIDLPRFAFPQFKQFHIIYYVAPRSGNWWLLKFPFFNGESYDLGQPNLPGYDEPAMAFQRRAIEVLCAHRKAFASHSVEPLVRTELPGVFANEFRAPGETVWTLYNANGRTVRQPVLKVKHLPGATYENAWAGRAIEPEVRDGFALLAVDVGPKAVGCVVQHSKR
jgi:hypothetical protein